MAEGRHLSIIVVPDGAGEESRTFRIQYRWLKLLGLAVGGTALVLTLMLGSWWYFAARAVRASTLEQEVERLRAEQSRVAILAGRLEELEARRARGSIFYASVFVRVGFDRSGSPIPAPNAFRR